MAIENTFIMVKPDGVRRALVGEIISRFERRTLTLEKIRVLEIDEDLARRHYAEHVEKTFNHHQNPPGLFPGFIGRRNPCPVTDLRHIIRSEVKELVLLSGPVVAMQWSGEDAISVCRSVMGATDPKQADPGTIRGDFGLAVTQNLVHGSDGPESAARELEIFFG